MIPEGYEVVETHDPVANQEPDLVTRFRFRAERRAAKLNAARQVPSYRYAVRHRSDEKWEVRALQNVLMRKEP